MNLDKAVVIPCFADSASMEMQGEIGEMGVCVYMPVSAEVVPLIPASILAVPQWILLVSAQRYEMPKLQTFQFSHTCVQLSVHQLKIGSEVVREAAILSTVISPPRPVPIPTIREGLPVSPLELASQLSRNSTTPKSTTIPTPRSVESPDSLRDPRMTLPAWGKESAVVSTPACSSSVSKYRVDATGDQEGRQQRDRQDQGEQQKQKQKRGEVKVSNVTGKMQGFREPGTSSTPGVQEIFIRFMDLMAKILGQAEAEAHELYQKIKHRTDQIDLLTQLIQKINLEAKALDWSKQPDLLTLIDKARAIGVDVPAGKTQWTEEEKRLFKENIQLRKDSLEKITQLERTDMQRYLQEASQCHQARSNILKLHKEVMDTIIHNLRP